MSEEIVTLEQVFREEREEIVNQIQTLLKELEQMDLNDMRWSACKREILKLEMVSEYLADRISGKITGTFT